MGRINAMPDVGIVGGTGMSGRWRGVRPAAGASRLAIRSLLALIGGMLWFGSFTASELLDGGPEFDLWLFVGTIIATAIVGGIVGSSWGDDFALGLGSVAGVALSGLLVSNGPAGRDPGQVMSLALTAIVPIVLLSAGSRAVVRLARGS